MFIISPSVLAADFARLGEDVKKVKDAGATYIHLDVMDGIFVPNMSFGMPVIESLRKVSDIFFDVHLMITEPQRYIDDFIRAGADLITIHYESCDDPFSVASMIRSKGVKVAIALKPATPAEVLFPILPELDMALIMTVEPGFGGQKMMLDMVEKVRALRTYANEQGLTLDIQVDGGITPDNLKYATEAGANVVVAGSAIFKAEHPEEVIAEMNRQAELHPFGVGI
ncbi:MAG: ribulose-phosphate 3-epimerase [Clostridia bacterium]|nr:ribulose-phosphate 3-epimerase [Clostridia bacterium]